MAVRSTSAVPSVPRKAGAARPTPFRSAVKGLKATRNPATPYRVLTVRDVGAQRELALPLTWCHVLEAIGSKTPEDVPLSADDLYEGGAQMVTHGAIGGFTPLLHARMVRTAMTYPLGPAIVQSTWYEFMQTPSLDGVARAAGMDYGKMAYVVTSYDARRDMFRCLAPLGPSWGQVGRFWLPRVDLGRMFGKHLAVAIAIWPRQ